MSDFCFREIFFDNYYTKKFAEFLKPRIYLIQKGTEEPTPDYEVKGDSLLIRIQDVDIKDVDIDMFETSKIYPSKGKKQKGFKKVSSKILRVIVIPDGRVMEFKIRKDLFFVCSCYEDGILYIDFEQKVKQE